MRKHELSDETFAFYLGLGSNGVRSVYGVNLSDNAHFLIGSGSSYSLQTGADGTESVIVLNEDGSTSVMYAIP